MLTDNFKNITCKHSIFTLFFSILSGVAVGEDYINASKTT